MGHMAERQKSYPFGYQNVTAERKQDLVRGIFDRVADRYDIMNDLMSGGLHRVWKAHMVAALAVPQSPSPFHLIDIAGGTGDIALLASKHSGTGFHASIIDINHNMLKVGQKRAQKTNKSAHINFIQGDAEALPLKDASAHACTIAFGIRNVTNMEKALAESFRTLKTGGHFLCLEFSHVNQPMLDRLYHMWSFHVIPHIGQFIVGERAAYQYLVESIRRFPKPEDFANLLTATGFSHVRFERLSGGIATLHSAWKD